MAACGHVEEVRADWPPVSDPVCEDCADKSWVSLRRCLTCGHVGCCDSSPGLHATAHHKETGHPMVETLQPGQDWAWCYVDEVSMRQLDGGWVQVDLFFEAGVAYMRDHVNAGGDPNVDEDFIYGKGFPLGQWVAEMRRRDLTDDQRAQIEALGVSLGGG
jgi:Zn-finger in ubiquitin-hydrolases and other protein/Helicase associated domain